jgi:1-acyl-sn-glycerol-3-phosphate acyltransferase
MWIRKVIGVVTLGLVGLLFVSGDLVSRLVVAPLARAFPAHRESLRRVHARGLRRGIFFILRWVGRSRFEIRPVIPCRSGILIVMNHQSLLDIMVGAAAVPDGYPRFVAHVRYARGIPLVSHMLRMYGHIVVLPGATGRAAFERLAESAREAQAPVAIFPEGHRSTDGEIGPWRRGGLDTLLSARAWTVYGVVVDGVRCAAGLRDFISNISAVRCRVEGVGPFEYDGRGVASHGEFTKRLRDAMCAKLAEMRRTTHDKAVEAQSAPLPSVP